MSGRRLGLEWRGGVLTFLELEVGDAGREVVAAARWVPPDDGSISAAALASTLSDAGLDGGPAVLALGGSATLVKPLWLPPLPDATLAEVLREEEERFFLWPEGPRCYGFFPAAPGEAERDDANGQRPRWAVAASATEVKELLDALEGAGIHVRRVTATEALYPDLAAGVSGDSGRAASGTALRITKDGGEWVRFRDGVPEDIRRLEPDDLRGEETPLPRGDADTTEAGRWILLADADRAASVAVSTGNREVVRPDVGGEDGGCFGGALAAALAERSSGSPPDLMPPEVRRVRRRRSRRTTAVLAGTVIALLALCLLLADRRAERRDALLDRQVEAARAAAAPVVQKRETVRRIARRLAAFRDATSERTSHLDLLASLSRALPEGAWLVSYVAGKEDGEVLLTGYARSATESLARVSELGVVDAVRFQRPTRTVDVGGDVLESFTLAVTLSREPTGRRAATAGVGN